MDSFCQRMPPGHVVRAAASGANLGIFHSFMTLLGEALDAPAVAFADQDDVWLPNKLSRALDHLRMIDPSKPAVYCGRQILVDTELRRIGASPKPRRPPSFPGLLLQNVGTGCTIVMNQAAARAVHASKKPNQSVHDWWVCLYVAAIDGIVLFDDMPVVLYRQHRKNAIGAPSSALRRLIRALSRGAGPHNAQLVEHLDALLRSEATLTLEAAHTAHQIKAKYAGSWRTRIELLRLPGFQRQAHTENVLLALWLLRGNLTIRHRLKNRATLFLHETLVSGLRWLLIYKDRLAFSQFSQALPEIRCVKEPPSGLSYSLTVSKIARKSILSMGYGNA
jgi:hypothetical protein